jgi:hypothetical protein
MNPRENTFPSQKGVGDRRTEVIRERRGANRKMEIQNKKEKTPNQCRREIKGNKK